MSQDTIFVCDELVELQQHDALLTVQNKELLARCDLLEAEIAALVEAVKKEHLAFDALDDAGFQLGEVGMPIWTDHAAARAEVDRLIANETADCKGEK